MKSPVFLCLLALTTGECFALVDDAAVAAGLDLAGKIVEGLNGKFFALL